MNMIEACKQKVKLGGQLTRKEALRLWEEPVEELCRAADEIRAHFCDNRFDICTIINGKSGRCSENCKYCAQSAHYHTYAEEYPLLGEAEIFRQAVYHAKKGVLRYSIVTSGRRLSESEIDTMCKIIRKIKKAVDISVCVSFGLLEEDDFRRLKEAGVERVHNNLEASERFFPKVCTTHTFQDKVNTIRAAQRAGLSVCSGGIIGLGETPEDRIDMALTLRELEIQSVPVNLLNPILGTPYERQERLSEEELRKTVAIYRFLLPRAAVRLAGGRGLLKDKGESCLKSGANALISGDMLTTAGYATETDLEMIARLGYEVARDDG